MSKRKVERKELSATKRIELEHIISVLMNEVEEDDTPCECGLYCPFYDDKNPDEYCPIGSDCAEGMAKYIEELFEEE